MSIYEMRAVKQTLHSPFFLPKCAYLTTSANSNRNYNAINDDNNGMRLLNITSKTCVSSTVCDR